MEDVTSFGERLLRSAETAREAGTVTAEVEQQLAAALHGPLAAALHATAPADGQGGGGEDDAAAAGRLLNTEIPRRFIAAGACLSTAYAALAAGDESRVAGALLSAERFLFPHDPAGAAAVSQAVSAATERLFGPGGPPSSSAGAGSAGAGQVEAMQRSVAAASEALERAYQAAAGHIQVAALSTRSWLAATGGVGPGSVAGQTQFGPFLDGLLRWAFYVEAALQGVRADDWSRAGAALVAARHVVGGAP